MDFLRTRVIRLAHGNQGLRPHLLPILTRTAGNIVEALLDREGQKASLQMRVLGQYLAAMDDLAPEVKSADSIARQKFMALYDKLFKVGEVLARSGDTVAKYADTVDDRDDDDRFIAARQLLHASLSDWKRNAVNHHKGGQSVVVNTRLLQAQTTVNHAWNIARWVQEVADLS